MLKVGDIVRVAEKTIGKTFGYSELRERLGDSMEVEVIRASGNVFVGVAHKGNGEEYSFSTSDVATIISSNNNCNSMCEGKLVVLTDEQKAVLSEDAQVLIRAGLINPCDSKPTTRATDALMFMLFTDRMADLVKLAKNIVKEAEGKKKSSE